MIDRMHEKFCTCMKNEEVNSFIRALVFIGYWGMWATIAVSTAALALYSISLIPPAHTTTVGTIALVVVIWCMVAMGIQVADGNRSRFNDDDELEED